MNKVEVSNVNRRFRNLRWEAGDDIDRSKHWEEGSSGFLATRRVSE